MGFEAAEEEEGEGGDVVEYEAWDDPLGEFEELSEEYCGGV